MSRIFATLLSICLSTILLGVLFRPEMLVTLSARTLTLIPRYLSFAAHRMGYQILAELDDAIENAPVMSSDDVATTPEGLESPNGHAPAGFGGPRLGLLTTCLAACISFVMGRGGQNVVD